MSELGDAGSIASILGVFIGIGSVAYAFFIKRKVDSISKKQKENAQGPYKLNTDKNLNDIHKYFKDILRITKNTDGEGDELEELENPSNVNAELNSYYQAEKSKMQRLLEKSNDELKGWIDLDQGVRLDFEKIISDFQWLINDFFEINQDEEMQIRIWTENHPELINKKHSIGQILKANKDILS